jgi:hypothetical protein
VMVPVCGQAVSRLPAVHGHPTGSIGFEICSRSDANKTGRLAGDDEDEK